MRRHKLIVIVLVLALFSTGGCATADQVSKADYELLCSAVSACSYTMIGKYPDSMPDDLTPATLLSVCKANIPSSYYEMLERYPLKVKPKGSYYLLLIYDNEGKNIIMFDYSCTPKCDGRVMLHPGKYNVEKIESYDPCGAVPQVN